MRAVGVTYCWLCLAWVAVWEQGSGSRLGTGAGKGADGLVDSLGAWIREQIDLGWGVTYRLLWLASVAQWEQVWEQEWELELEQELEREQEQEQGLVPFHHLLRCLGFLQENNIIINEELNSDVLMVIATVYQAEYPANRIALLTSSA